MQCLKKTKSNISGYVTAIADSARILCEQSGKTLSIGGVAKYLNLQGMHYFNLTQIDEKAYATAIEQIVLEAANKALDLNVTFR